MKKLTKQQFLDMKIGELFKIVKDEDERVLCFIHINNLGIELIPEKPPVTVQNLGRFMAKFGDYPLAQGLDSEIPFEGVLTTIYKGIDELKDVFIIQGHRYLNCKVVDTRWCAENIEGGDK